MTNLDYAKARVTALLEQVTVLERQSIKCQRAIERQRLKLECCLIELPEARQNLEYYQAYIEAVETGEIMEEAA